MKHYHGTPIGGTRMNGESFAAGRFMLVPWKRPEDLEMVSVVSRGFIADNSAYSFWTTGETPNWNDYIKWCGTFCGNPRFDFALIPDVIDGTEKDNAELVSLWDKKAWHPKFIEGCPVWHLHESFERLNMYCERFRRVAIGSSGQFDTPGTNEWIERMDDAFDVICKGNDGYPRAKIHGLRMLASNIVMRYPFASCDSTNAVQNGPRTANRLKVDALWGMCHIARTIEQVQSPCTWNRVRAKQGDLFELTGLVD